MQWYKWWSCWKVIIRCVKEILIFFSMLRTYDLHIKYISLIKFIQTHVHWFAHGCYSSLGTNPGFPRVLIICFFLLCVGHCCFCFHVFIYFVKQNIQISQVYVLSEIKMDDQQQKRAKIIRTYLATTSSFAKKKKKWSALTPSQSRARQHTCTPRDGWTHRNWLPPSQPCSPHLNNQKAFAKHGQIEGSQNIEYFFFWFCFIHFF